jgi:glutaredoxin
MILQLLRWAGVGCHASQKVQFKTIDVANDKHLEELFEEGTKEVQPTFPFPQIFAKGKIVVGLDMIKDLLEV